jgi:sulfur carrier protein ThiS
VSEVQIVEKQKEISSIQSYKVVSNTTTVRELLRELKLEQKFFAILVNGKRVDLDSVIEKGSEIVILPKIAGG